MDAFLSYLNDLVSQNKEKFAKFPNIKWLNPYEAFHFQDLRDGILGSTENTSFFKGTKPYYRQISNGCQTCGNGKWSCLFITGKCNAGCFYCPAPQEIDEIPSSQGFSFPTAQSYAQYINKYGFKGVSFSGGEPLLVKERVYDYLKTVRAVCDKDIYIWMYTNGLLAQPEIFDQLAELGLNEVRFDIGATNYKLDKILMAKNRIKNITIEIPAIPEEKEKLKALLPDMIAAGVTNLNLHQLRLTEHNAPKLLQHNYTYIPAEKPIVLESELAALEIMDYARKNKLNIGVNYCSFFFKNRFQSAGFRKQIAEKVPDKSLVITEKGFLRKIEPDKITYFAPRLAKNADASPDIQSEPIIDPVFSVNTQALSKTALIPDLIKQMHNNIPEDQDLFNIWKYEWIEGDIRNY